MSLITHCMYFVVLLKLSILKLLVEIKKAKIGKDYFRSNNVVLIHIYDWL